MIPRPKILTAFDVPAGGWDLKVYKSASVSFDTPVTATVPAGTYYVAWDGQADDFMDALAEALRTALSIGAALWMSESNRIGIKIFLAGSSPTPDVRIAWTELDGPAIAAVLGFDASADDSSTGTDNPEFAADWQHAFGWYANEDGLLRSLGVHDVESVVSLQQRTESGVVKSQRVARRSGNEMALQFIPRALMWSAERAYGDSSAYPYARNEPLQCWWKEAQRGTPFRVYRDGAYGLSRAGAVVPFASSDATTFMLSGATLESDAWIGRLAVVANLFGAVPMRFFIESHTGTVITTSGYAGISNIGAGVSPAVLHLVNQGYETYVLDLSRMSEFSPRELDKLDRYDIDIPLFRYVP